MTIRALATLSLAAAAALFAAGAAAQEVCAPSALGNPAARLSDIYPKAEGYAKAWEQDAIPVRIENMAVGPLQPDGTSTAWRMQFYSKSAEQSVFVGVASGMLTCWAMPAPPGRIPDLKPGFFLDGAKLYALAKQHGGDLLARGFSVMLGTDAEAHTHRAFWYLTFAKDRTTDGGLVVVADANTGAFEKTLRR